MPSLADVLAAIPHAMILDVELKGATIGPWWRCSPRGAARARQRVVSSFDADTLERIGGLAPGVAALAQRAGPDARRRSGGGRPGLPRRSASTCTSSMRAP